MNSVAKVQRSISQLQRFHKCCLFCHFAPLANVPVGDIPISIDVFIVILAYGINKERDRCICGDHSADDGAAVFWLCLKGLRPFVHKDAVGGAGDECGVDVP